MNMNRVKERFILMRPVMVPFILYIGLLAFATNWVANNPQSDYRMLVALLPVIPSIWIAVLIVQFIKKLDELEQRIIHEAASFSFMLTLLLVLVFSLLSFSGLPTPNPMYLLLVMVVLLAVGKLAGNRRYK
jgi:uncharacterized membrane protein (DUF485 family)